MRRVSDLTESGSRTGTRGGDPAGVSVIIPCYNQGRFLADAIESVLRQTRPVHEIIVVDDGSTDDTAEVAGRYETATLVRQANSGLSAARNAGTESSSGRYLVFLDADDRLLPTAVEDGLNCLERNPDCAFAYGRFRWIEEDGSPVEQLPMMRRRGENAWHAFLEGNFIGMHATVMYRREPLVAAGGFDPRLRLCEDYDVYLRIAREHPICEHSGTVAEYRLNPAGLSADNARMLETVIGVIERQLPHVTDPAGRRSLKRGRRAWRDYYGERMVDELIQAVRNGRWSEAGRTAVTIGRLCRGQTPFIFVLYLVPLKLRRLPWRVLRHSVVGQR